MKTIKLVIILCISNLLLGCTQQSESIKVTTDFWKGMATNNKELLESVLAKKEDAEFLSKGKSTLTNYEILGEVSGGVEVKFSKFCYPDITAPTILKSVDGSLKVDLFATLRAQMKAHKKAIPLRKYCYEFENKPLSGSLAGIKWSFVKSNSREINWGDKVTTNTTLYSEDCDTDTHGKCTKPSLLISHLDLAGEGGNFTNTVNVTIHTPPGTNHIISSGSYRVSNEGVNKKVEISFSDDEKNRLSGFYIIEGE